jgi:hypothetical protein
MSFYFSVTAAIPKWTALAHGLLSLMELRGTTISDFRDHRLANTIPTERTCPADDLLFLSRMLDEIEQEMAASVEWGNRTALWRLLEGEGVEPSLLRKIWLLRLAGYPLDDLTEKEISREFDSLYAHRVNSPAMIAALVRADARNLPPTRFAVVTTVRRGAFYRIDRLVGHGVDFTDTNAVAALRHAECSKSGQLLIYIERAEACVNWVVPSGTEPDFWVEERIE